MNYSNMLEEGKLKKSFIVATLVSTVIGTLTASIALHDKIQDKRQRTMQQKTDNKQDSAIQSINQKLDLLQVGGGRSNDSRSHPSRSRRGRRRDSYDKDDFGYQARRSRAMIEQRYEDNLMRVGQNYGRGDIITENKLQAQIIALQQSVIDILQEALLNDRQLSRSDIRKLVNAQEHARIGSLDALDGHYKGGEQKTRERLITSLNPENARDLPPPRRIKSLPAPSISYCRYSQDLQRSRQQLSSDFDVTGDCRCPACGLHISADLQDYWVFTIRTPTEDNDEQSTESRSFSMGARFVVKCHNEDGKFACVLCSRHRDVDCICKSVDALVRHLGRDHFAEEFEQERDFVLVKD